MKRRQIDITARTDASADAAFRLLADGTTWTGWSPMDSFELERAGDPPPEGVGAIRVFRRGRTTGRDEIVEVVPGRRLGYRSLSGLPLRDYRATVDLEDGQSGPSGQSGTVIRWRASFEPKIPGTGRIFERGLGKFLQQCADGLARAAAAGGS
ncbi:MAG: SRPBCC family protein [Ilumatobacteraceae bacterium]